MTLTDLALGVVIVVGLVGIVLPFLPGSLMVLAAILLWALETRTAAGWAVFAAAGVLLSVGVVVKYAVPGRRLQRSGVPSSTLLVGVALGVVGFFVVPVVGLLLGFVLGVYIAEQRRLGAARAWPSTKAALRAIGLGILIELCAGVLAALVWLVGVFVT